ncbi:MAG: hypothetical protein QG622_1736 [Actinomycetota bacterium]|nr:hypothetical protein [Actinomycetota bacterium]
MLMVLALLPLVLVPLGGLIGGVTGACAVLANFAVVRTNVSRVAQVLIMMGVLLAAAVVWIVVATAFQMAIG